MTGPQIPAVSRYTFDKCLPRTLAQPLIIGLFAVALDSLTLVNGSVVCSITDNPD